MRTRFLSHLLLLIASFFLGEAPCQAYYNESRQDPGIVTSYQPTYVLSGAPDSKIQLSFKIQPIQGYPAFLSYTQVMYWQLLTAESSPFRDVNYNPGVFHRFLLGPEGPTRRWLDLGVFEHESNGRAGEESRAWDRIYLRYDSGAIAANELRWGLHWNFKLAVPIHYDKTNKDYARYRGIWELNLTLVDFMGPAVEYSDLSLRLYPGGAIYITPWLGGQELTMRVKLGAKRLWPLVVLQFFHGFAESMLNYKEERLGLRIGLGL